MRTAPQPTMRERCAIVQAANARGFTVEDELGQSVEGRLLGYSLPHPRVSVWHGTFEISWDLARRLANGEARRVLA